MSFLRRIGDFLFGEASYLGGASIRSGLNPHKWRPGKRSTELKVIEATKLARHQAVSLKPVAPVSAAVSHGAVKLKPAAPTIPAAVSHGVVSLKPAAPAPAVAAAAKAVVRLPRVPTIPAAVSHGVVRLSPAASSATHRSHTAMMGLFLDGMGMGDDPTTVKTPTGTYPVDPGSGLPYDPVSGVWIDPTTGQPRDPSAPPPDPAPATDANGQPYVGNATVWMSAETVPFYWSTWEQIRGLSEALGDPRPRDPELAKHARDSLDAFGAWLDAPNLKKLPDPVLYPDGTPVTGHIWLPKLSLPQLNPQAYTAQVLPRIVNDRLEKSSLHTGPIYSNIGQDELPGYQYQGTHNRKGTSDPLWNGGQVEPWGPRAEWLFKDGVQAWYMGINMDWSGLDPTTAAYPWLYDQFGVTQFIHWLQTPADLWRSDGVDISDASPVFLAGPPWVFHCVEFLDALYLGTHGLPRCVTDDGKFDFNALAQWAGSDPKWSRLLDAWGHQPFMLATIYDVAEVAVQPGKNATVPVPQQPTPPTVPAGAIPPVSVSTATTPTGTYPIDQVAGLPYEPSTGDVIDPVTGQKTGGNLYTGVGLPASVGTATAPDGSTVSSLPTDGGYVDYGDPQQSYYDYGTPQFVNYPDYGAYPSYPDYGAYPSYPDYGAAPLYSDYGVYDSGPSDYYGGYDSGFVPESAALPPMPSDGGYMFDSGASYVDQEDQLSLGPVYPPYGFDEQSLTDEEIQAIYDDYYGGVY